MTGTMTPPTGFRGAGSSPAELLKPAETVHFYQDDGYKMEGDILVRTGVTPKLAVIFCTGWGGTRALGTNASMFATGIADRVDALTLNIDYSGFGGSEGP